MNSTEKLNVLVIVRPAREAGAEMLLVQAAARLNPARFRVICGLLTPDEDNLIPPAIPTLNFNLPQLHGLAWLKFFLRLCWVLLQHKIQIIHVNSYIPGNYARLAAILTRVPIIIDHWHGFTRFTLKRKMICRALGRFTDLSLAVSWGVAAHLVQQCQLDPDKIRVVPNAVDYARFQGGRSRELVRQELGLPLKTPVVGLVARLEHWGKGHKELFEALALIKEQHPAQALIVGGGRRQGEMAQLAKNLGLSQVVHFLGERPDIPNLLKAMDVFVLPSHSEGISLALLEAMAAGLPVIVSEVGGLPEVVRHEENGLLIPVGDAAALAQSLTRVFEDPAWAKSLGDNARQDIQAHYSLDRLGREINEVYEELVERRFGGGGQGA
ncbi:MAG: glycosyltransferase [Desulfobaccales bacterium]|nr:glycosyltransferase [Desulfobaccales bacterium]